jgi:hypothetical protein
MTEVMVAIVVIWMLFGIVYAIGMGRRGYDPWSWGALGAIFGPLVIPLAIGLRRRRPMGQPLITASDLVALQREAAAQARHTPLGPGAFGTFGPPHVMTRSGSISP